MEGRLVSTDGAMRRSRDSCSCWQCAVQRSATTRLGPMLTGRVGFPAGARGDRDLGRDRPRDGRFGATARRPPPALPRREDAPCGGCSNMTRATRRRNSRYGTTGDPFAANQENTSSTSCRSGSGAGAAVSSSAPGQTRRAGDGGGAYLARELHVAGPERVKELLAGGVLRSAGVRGAERLREDTCVLVAQTAQLALAVEARASGEAAHPHQPPANGLSPGAERPLRHGRGGANLHIQRDVAHNFAQRVRHGHWGHGKK